MKKCVSASLLSVSLLLLLLLLSLASDARASQQAKNNALDFPVSRDDYYECDPVALQHEWFSTLDYAHAGVEEWHSGDCPATKQQPGIKDHAMRILLSTRCVIYRMTHALLARVADWPSWLAESTADLYGEWLAPAPVLPAIE